MYFYVSSVQGNIAFNGVVDEFNYPKLFRLGKLFFYDYAAAKLKDVSLWRQVSVKAGRVRMN
jgi:hypothetical protein